MNLQKQPEYDKGLFMYRVLNNEAPEYLSNLYTHTPSRYSNSIARLKSAKLFITFNIVLSSPLEQTPCALIACDSK